MEIEIKKKTSQSKYRISQTIGQLWETLITIVIETKKHIQNG